MPHLAERSIIEKVEGVRASAAFASLASRRRRIARTCVRRRERRMRFTSVRRSVTRMRLIEETVLAMQIVRVP